MRRGFAAVWARDESRTSSAPAPQAAAPARKFLRVVFIVSSSFFKLREIQIVARARDFTQFPFGPLFRVERRRFPRLHERNGIRHRNFDLHMILVDAIEALV